MAIKVCCKKKTLFKIDLLDCSISTDALFGNSFNLAVSPQLQTQLKARQTRKIRGNPRSSSMCIAHMQIPRRPPQKPNITRWQMCHGNNSPYHLFFRCFIAKCSRLRPATKDRMKYSYDYGEAANNALSISPLGY